MILNFYYCYLRFFVVKSGGFFYYTQKSWGGKPTPTFIIEPEKENKFPQMERFVLLLSTIFYLYLQYFTKASLNFANCSNVNASPRTVGFNPIDSMASTICSFVNERSEALFSPFCNVFLL